MALMTSEKQIITIDKNGNLKLINSGEPILPGDIVIEYESGEVSVDLADDSEKNNDINNILNAIASGEDPSVISEAPAAGEEGGSSLTASTEIERIGKSTIAETNFDTSSLETIGLSRIQSLTLLEQYKSFRETGDFQITIPNNELIKSAPSIFIAEIDENGVINEEQVENGIQVDITLPEGTEGGDIIELSDGTGTVVGTHLITEDDITSGSVEITVSAPKPDGSYEYVAEITDPAGDIGPSSNKVEFELDTSADAGTVTVADITADDVINAAESGQVIAVTGTATGGDISENDVVTMTINGTDYQTTVDENGNWSVDVAGADLANDSEFEVSVASTDVAGNTINSTATSTHTVDTSADTGTVTVADITADDVINAAESGQVIAVTGTATGGDISENDVVTMTINGTDYQTTVDENGNWSVDVAGNDLASDTEFEVVVTSNDAAGNTIESSATSTHTVDLVADAGTVTVADITADDVINAAESGQVIAVTGTATGGDISENDVVTMTINGTDYQTTVDENGNWSVDVAGNDLANDTEFEVVVTSNDAAGNTIESSATSTHTVDLVADAGTVTVADITADDVINAAESGQVIAVTGTATGGDISENDVVTMTINGIDYQTTVDENGNWSVDVAGNDLANDTEFEVVVTSNDAAGNTIESSATSTHTVDLVADAGTVTVADITADDVINAAESGQVIAVTGTATGGDISENDVVTMTINGTDYQTTVDESGNWSVDVAGNDLANDTEFEVVVTSNDAAGNTIESSATSTHTVDLVADAGTVTVADITEDDVINAAESGQVIAVTGTATGGDISENDVVTMTINGTDYQTTVDENGNWSVDVAGNDLASDTEFEVVVTSNDAAGNTIESSATSTHTVDLVADAGTVTVADITEDDVINAAESGQVIAVTGTATGGDISENDVVTMTINGTDYQTTVDENGNWSVDVAGNDLANDTEFEVVVTSNDAAGNTIESSATSTHTVDLVADVGTVTVADITADDVINAAESGQVIAVTGTATGGDISENDVVTMTINGIDYQTTVDESGNWSVDVAGADLANDTEFEAVVASTDAAGNEVNSTATSTHTVDLVADAGTVTVADITADDVINAAESGQVIAVTGTATGGDISENDVVTMTINGTDYQTMVDENGNWSVDVAGNDLASDTEFEVVVTSNDAAGNTIESSATSTHTVDLVADVGTVTVADITADDVINAAESGQVIAVTGTATGGDISENDVVTMTINGIDYQTTVDESGNWSVDVAGADLANDTEFEAVVTSNDAAGNTIESSATSTHTVDLVADAGTVTVADITADDVINAAESGQVIAVTGTATGGDISENDVVTMTINGIDYQTTVDESGNWSVDVAGADLANDTEFEAVVTSNDAAGNTIESSATSTHTVDLVADAGTVTVADITADDVINAAESGQVISVTGTATDGDISENDVVTMTINGTDYQTTVDENGNWSVDVAGNDLASDTEFEVVVTSNDAAGNTIESSATSTHTVDLVADAGTVTVADITEDDVINAAESGQVISVTGTATGGDISENDVVTMTINGTDYQTTVDENGNWSVDVAGNDLANDTEFEVVVTSNDAAGNTIESSATSTHTVDLVADAGTVTVADITADDVINAAESGQVIAVTGTATGGDISENDVVTMTINGTDYQTTVDENGNWSVDVAGADLANDTEFEVVVASTDAAGNEVNSTATSTHTVDLVADVGTVTVADITADDVINAAESGQVIAVTGTATGGDISENDVVTMTINGTDYQTTVDENGNWSVDVAGNDLANDTEFEVVVTSNDAAGNTIESSATSTHTVDLVADVGTVTVADITADDVINAAESGQVIAVTGTATGGDISENDVVTMTINGIDYQTTVDESGNWSVDVAGADLANDTEFEAVVTSNDAAGNTIESSATSTHTVDLVADAGTVTVADITADDVINAAESGQVIAVTGTATGGDISENDVVTMTINGIDYQTTVDESGNWSVDVAGADLANDTEFEAVVTSNDAAGNTIESSATSTHTVDLVADAGTVTVADITADDVINAAESGQVISVTGTATDGDISENDVVTMTINGTDYQTTVDENGNWSVDVAGNDLASDTEFEVVVTSNDAAGNTIESSATSTHTVDLVADAGTVTVADITEDDVINAAESGQVIAVTGTATGGDISENDVVTMTINGIDYQTTVDESGNWSVDVAGADLANDTEFEAVVTSNDAAGNTIESSATSTHTVDLVADAGTVTVADITADDVINAAESGQVIAVTGTATGGDISENDVVTMTINGIDYQTTVDESGNWSVDVAGADLANDTEFEAVVTSNDAAGNTIESSATSTHTVDLVADAGTVTVADITADDVINAAESGQVISVTGTATDGDISENDVVTMTINGTDYQTTVDENGNWSVDVAGNDLASDTEFEVVVTSNDAAGNTIESSATSTHTVDLVADAGTVTVADITEDDVINAAESGQVIAVTGTATGGDISENDVVTMTINGTDYQTTVDENGNWSVDVAGADLANDTEFEVVVASTDAAGNEVNSTATSTHTVDLVADVGTVTVADITADDVINAAESGQVIAVTGTATGGDISENDVVTMTINGTDYQTTVDENGNWSVDVAGNDLASDTEFEVVVTSNDAAGNTIESSATSTHTVDLVADAGTVTVADITEDDVINAAESGQVIAVTGTATGGDISENDVVTMTINGTDYQTTVDENGNWSVDVAGNDLANDTEFEVVVTSNDAAGNTIESSATSTHTVDLVADAGTVTVADITADDVINAAESGQVIAVTGTATGGDISENDVVTMTINGIDYQTTVDENGNWSVDVAGNDLANDTEFEVVVTSNDAAGNTIESSATSTHTVDLVADAGTVTVADITADDVINAAESGQVIAVTGTATGGDISENDVVTMTINGTDYQTTVDESGNWSVDVAGADLANDTEFEAVVTSNDAAGNTIESSATSTHTVDLVADAGTVTVADITADDVINAAESGQVIAVTGTAIGGDISENDVVTMTINGTDYQTTVDESGNWSVDVAGADLANDTEFEVVVASTDAAGNEVNSTATSTHTVDLVADAGTVTVADITADDVINAAESGQVIAVTGTATGGDISENDVVTMTINGTDYQTTVDENGNWSVDVAGNDLANDTEFEVVVTSNDAAGNTIESSATSTHTVDLVADAGTVTVADITADDVINAAESGQVIAVTGTATGGDISENDVVTMTINGTDYQTTVDENGNWSVDVAGNDLANDTEFEVVVTSNDAAGNTIESSATSTHTVDLVADAGTVTVADITADDVINAAESGQVIAVTGTATGGDISENDVVTMTINGTDYQTTVDENGNWSVDVAGNDLANDTEFEVSVASTDAAGNEINSTATSTHTLDLVADAGTVTVADITADDVINAAESGQVIAVTGTATGGDISENDVVTMTINGTDYQTTVDENGNWSVDVAGNDLANDTEFEVVVTSNDAAGNTIESSATSTHTVDLVADAGTVTVADITEDDVINAAESGQVIAVTGTATGGDISENDVVTMTINGIDYQTTVDENGNWSVDVAGNDLANDTEFEVVVTSNDAAGNTIESSATSTHTVDLVADAGTVTVADITADDVINAAESGQVIAVTGTATGGDISENDVVTMTINGTDYQTTVDESGNWSVDVAGNDLANDTEFEVVVTSNDAAGNTIESSATSTHTVDLVADAGTVTVADITADDVINAAESGQVIAVTGTATGGDISENDVVTMTINGTDYQTTVDENGNWSVDVAGNDLASDTEFEVVVTSNDAAGNTIESSATSTHTVDLVADAGTVTVADITADDVINAAESGQVIAVTGTATGGDISENDVVTMTINGTDYQTTVDESGNWSVDVAGNDLANDTEFEVVVTSNDAAGNTIESSATSTHTVDLVADAGTVTVADITADDVINAAESGQVIAVTGTATGGDISENDVVTMTINGTDYQTTVDENGNWSVDVTGNDLANDTEFEVVVTSTDMAGNTINSTATSIHTVDTQVIGLTSDITNATNTGSNADTVTNIYTPDITGVTEAGATVTINYTDANNQAQTATGTADMNGVYTIGITNSLKEGSNSLFIVAEDAVGNTISTTQDVTVNSAPIATDFEITLTDDASVQFTFEPHVSDIEDDASNTDGKSIEIQITNLPELGTLYLVDGASRIEITAATVLTEDSQIEYVLDDTINDDLSFNATEDFAPNYNNGTVTSFTLASGVIVSGGTYSGTRPDTTSTLMADELYYDSATNETGLGVGNREIDVNSKDYIEVDFTHVGNANTTDVDIKEVNIDFGSVYGHYSENSNANAEIHILLFKDGALVGESPYIFDDETHNVYDGSGEFTANIQLDSGFDQIRVYTVHGEGSTASNSNVTLQGVEVVDAMVSEDIPYQAADSDDATDTGVITVSTDSTERAINNAPIIDDSVFNATYEDVAIPLNLNDLLITDLDGDDITLTNITVDPAFGSLELIFNGDEVIGAQFTPAENVHFDSNNAVEFEITATDGYQSSTGTATLIVNAVADEPTLSVVLGESAVAGPGFDTSDVDSIKDFFANGGTIPGIGNVVYSGEMVLGDDGNNLIIGTGVVNNLIGDSASGTGNDIFVGGANNDSIYGGTGPLDFGIDGVIYSGKISEYLIVNQGGAHGGGIDHWVVTDTLGRDTGYDHTAPEDNGDQLYQIERLIFSDAIVELNPDGTYTILQETETALDLSASVMDTDGSEYLDAINISGLPAGAQIIDKDSNQPLGEFKEVNGEQVWVIDIIGENTQTVNYDNLVIRYPSTETLDIDVSAVAKESSNNSEATTTVNASPSQDINADQGGETPTTLISLVLDSSGSMNHQPFKSDDSNPDQDKTRMELVLEASIAMLDNVNSQEGSEEVLVQLVDFDNQKHHSEDENVESLGWFTVQSAINTLNAALGNIAAEDGDKDFYPDGGTDYEEGIYAVISGYQDIQVTNITGETNDVVYFFSDGNNDGGWQGGTNGPKDIWENFIIGKDVTAIGIVRDSDTTLSGLNKISDKIIYLTDGQLFTELPKLRPTIGQAGALLMGIIGLDAAAIVIDETKAEVLRVIEQDGVISNTTYVVSQDNNQLLIDTEYGDLRIEEDGSYYFQPSLSAPEIEGGKSVAFEVLYTTVDDNGIEDEQLVTLNISPSGEVNAAVTSSLNASTGDDVVIGTDNADIILGHEGNDILIGGLGDDILVGGAGEDIFKWIDQGVDTGTDTIKDFTVGEDLIDLTEIISGNDSAVDMEDLLSHVTVSESGNDLTLAITDDSDNNHTIIVEGGVGSFGLEDANFSNQSEILTQLLDNQLFKLDNNN
ncbi:Ig-like domain-containing protein [Aliivibrio logei]|uniref:Ig-like domain-containing protein n=1 Tax=Aliivibrio logei TaxID=688 RepID=UPI0035C8F162